MECPKCGYVMGPFDDECKRCARMARENHVAQPPQQQELSPQQPSPPQSDSEQDSTVHPLWIKYTFPGRFFYLPYPAIKENNSITKQRLTLAGWLAITSAVLMIPILALSVFLGFLQYSLPGPPGGLAKLALVLLSLVGLVLFIFIFSALQGLLNTRFGFRDTDILIGVLIYANVAFTLVSFLQVMSPVLTIVAAVVALVLGVAYGIVCILFAITLLRLPDTLYGMLQPFAYACMVCGFCFATIVLSPVALIASLIAYIMLGIIFIRAAESSTEATGKLVKCPKCNAVTARDDKFCLNCGTKLTVQQPQPQRKCPQCETEVNEPTAKFCANCGGPL